jgi:hypothetical protein
VGSCCLGGLAAELRFVGIAAELVNGVFAAGLEDFCGGGSAAGLKWALVVCRFFNLEF